MDRNFDAMQVVIIIVESLSARRAWIEIAGSLDDILAGVVALRKESVDRNVPFDVIRPAIDGRSPQGERG